MRADVWQWAGFCGWLLLTACAPAPAGEDELPGQLRLGALLGGADVAGFLRADTPRVFRFPDDHGPHPGFRSEWWYLTFMLEDEAGNPVGVQFTLFRQALAPEPPGLTRGWQTRQVFLAHFAVTHAGMGVHRQEERFARGHPRLAGVTADPFALWLENWRISSAGNRWRLQAGGSNMAVDLTLAMDGPMVLQGEAGLSRKSVDQASYYYSLPGMAVQGQVRMDGRSFEVRGSGWLDREWSSSVLSEAHQGWDWFALVFDDGRRVMLYQLRRRDGSRDPFDQGMLVTPGMPDRPLKVRDFSLHPGRFWHDGEGVAWPVAWTVRLGEEVWRVEAVLDDQAMETAIEYWEGLVEVRDEAGGSLGYGYLELTGYGGADVPEAGEPASGRRRRDGTEGGRPGDDG